MSLSNCPICNPTKYTHAVVISEVTKYEQELRASLSTSSDLRGDSAKVIDMCNWLADVPTKPLCVTMNNHAYYPLIMQQTVSGVRNWFCSLDAMGSRWNPDDNADSIIWGVDAEDLLFPTELEQTVMQIQMDAAWAICEAANVDIHSLMTKCTQADSELFSGSMFAE